MKEAIRQAIAAGVSVGQLSDAMDELGLPQNAGGGYRLLGGRGGTVFGRAFTLKQELVTLGEASVTRQGEAALSLASAGDILVIDAGGNPGVATWGEGHSLRAQINGLNGVVLHGATRDARTLEGGPLPILCRSTTPVRSKGRFRTASVGEPVNLADVKVATGDLLAIDMDGIVCLPWELAREVLTKALKILKLENKRDINLREQATRRPYD